MIKRLSIHWRRNERAKKKQLSGNNNKIINGYDWRRLRPLYSIWWVFVLGVTQLSPIPRCDGENMTGMLTECSTTKKKSHSPICSMLWTMFELWFDRLGMVAFCSMLEIAVQSHNFVMRDNCACTRQSFSKQNDRTRTSRRFNRVNWKNCVLLNYVFQHHGAMAIWMRVTWWRTSGCETK